MLFALKKEISLRRNDLENKTLHSLYFGGGTPSVLSADEIQSLIDEVLKYYDFDEDIEVTLEANPDDLDKKFLKNISQTPINRLSIGTQSFYDEDLRLMNRAHNASQAEDSIKRSQDFGFENLSIDLIYGSPTSDLQMWKNNLNKTVELQIPHISSYALTVEPKTTLNSWIRSQKVQAPKESEQNSAFYYMSDFLKEKGFQHYEISNFAKPGFMSRHNSAYWKSKEYLGIGPSAHSYNGRNQRSWNIANNAIYIKNLAENKIPNEKEMLSDKDRFNEMIMIGLRTANGVEEEQLKKQFDDEIITHYLIESRKKFEQGVLILENQHLKISEEHWFMADGIASDLFII